MITDFHVHAGDFHRLRDDIQALLKKFPFEDDVDVREVFSNPAQLERYLRRNGVGRAVILAECGPGTNFSIDSSMIAGFCKVAPEFFIPFGNINPNFHRDPVSEWDLGKELGIRGYKFYPADHSFDALLPSMMNVYGKCAQAAVPVMFHTGLTAQRDATERFIRPEEFRPIIEGFPGLPIVLAHSGKPNWHDEALEYALRYQNVYLDTALVSPSVVAELLRREPSASGKILFGSDWPVSGGYAAAIGKYLDSGIPDASRNDLFSLNAERLLAVDCRSARCGTRTSGASVAPTKTGE